MTGKWSLLVPGLVIAAAGICGCSTAAGPSGTASPLRSPPSSASSAKAAECTASSLALADLQEFSSATSTSLDGGALAKLNTTLRDLKALAGSPPSAKAGSLAMSIASSLKGLESLAQTDPHGTKETTRDQARGFEQQYMTSSQALSSAVAQACPGS